MRKGLDSNLELIDTGDDPQGFKITDIQIYLTIRNLASNAQAPLEKTLTGLVSSSVISGNSASRCDTRTTSLVDTLRDLS